MPSQPSSQPSVRPASQAAAGRSSRLPGLSLVVPVYGVRRYLPACLDSLLADPDPSIEIIAVDDASPDGCGALLDERAGADSRLTVLHLRSTAGPGNARNVGLAHATRDYVWFVDGDDFVPPGALARVRGRLGEDQPDLLLIDYQETYPDGGTRPSPGTDLLRSAPSGTFSLAEAPRLISLTMTSWSKIFRRDFLLGLHQPFRPGIHEDIPVTCAALFTGRLSASDQVCYGYRRARHGSFMATTSTDHLAVFSAYGEVFAMLADLAGANDPVATPAVRAAVFERAIWHYASVLQTTGSGIGPVGRPGLVPRGERRRFFERMHSDFVRYSPPGYQLPSGARGVKFRLIARDAYWAYELLEPVNKLRVAVRAAVRRVRRASGDTAPAGR